MEQVAERVEDAEKTGNAELIAVMRQVRKALVEIAENNPASTVPPAPAVVTRPTQVAKRERPSLAHDDEKPVVKASMRQFMMQPVKRGDGK
jgi:hypothetical protein